jgi:hypothetical protein
MGSTYTVQPVLATQLPALWHKQNPFKHRRRCCRCCGGKLLLLLLTLSALSITYVEGRAVQPLCVPTCDCVQWQGP